MTARDKVKVGFGKALMILVFAIFFVVLFIMATETPNIAQHRHNRIFPEYHN